MDGRIRSGGDDAVFEGEAADDAPGNFPEFVLRAPKGADGFEFGAEAFLAIAGAG